MMSDLWDQVPFGRDYAGIFRFRFWRFREGQVVVIDDYLKTKVTINRPLGGPLIYIRSVDCNEFGVR